MTLTALDVARLTRQAGFTGPALVTAVAIAHAESGFNPAAVGDVALEDATWGPSVGLWQVRTLKNPTIQVRDQQWLLADPAHQAAAAFTISARGTNFGPWSTYTSGAYKAFMGEAATAVNALLQEGSAMGAPNNPIVCLTSTPTGKGYWLVDVSGEVFAFGDAPYLGGLSVNDHGGYTAVYPPAS